MPFGPNKHFAGGVTGVQKAIIGGWELGGILSVSTGFTATVNISNPAALTAIGLQSNVAQPDLAPGGNSNPIRPGNPDQYFDPKQFVYPAPGYMGNLGRNTVTMPGIQNLDLTLKKNTSVTERMKLQFRLEMFNFFNHPQWGIPQMNVFDNRGRLNATAGQINTTAKSSRQIQLGLRLSF